MTTPTPNPEHAGWAESLAITIARELFREGDGPTPCQRIEFKGGKYPDKERPQGGYCEDGMAEFLAGRFKNNIGLANLRAQVALCHEMEQALVEIADVLARVQAVKAGKKL